MKAYQKLLIIVLVITVIAGAGLQLSRLRFKNKSGVPVYVTLDPIPTKNFPGQWYYFELEAGTRFAPVEKTFTVLPGKYQLSLQAGDPKMPVANPFCLTVKDQDKMLAGIQIEINKANMTMLFGECLAVQNFSPRYNTDNGFWKDFDGLWRMLFQYRPDKSVPLNE